MSVYDKCACGAAYPAEHTAACIQEGDATPALASACAAIKACVTIHTDGYAEWDDAALAALVAALLPPSDPTVHAIAVLGARVLREIVRGTDSYDLADAVLVAAESLLDDETYYATPAIAATVARLTEGDSNG